MWIICISEDNRKRLENSIDRIKSKSKPVISKNLDSTPLIISDEKKASDIYNDHLGLFMKAYNEGFGAVKGNIYYNGNIGHLIVINLSNVDKLKLTDNELDGVVSHELGHIFNEPPPKEMPSFLKGNTSDEIEEAKRKALLDHEIYADYFSKLTKTEKGLLASFQKYLNSDMAKYREVFDTRISKLNSNEEFIGRKKDIKLK